MNSKEKKKKFNLKNAKCVYVKADPTAEVLDRLSKYENKVLLALERIGEVLVSCAALIFSDFNFRPWSSRSWLLVLSFALMVLYEIYWIRYFRSKKTMEDFYSSILGIPVAGATLPVLAFLSLAVYGKNIILGVAVLILGIGHIGIHLMHKKEIGK